MSERYRNEAQQRICRLILLLAGNEMDGVQPSTLAKALDTNPSNVTRDLWNLQEAGFVDRIGDSDRWRLGPKVVQVAISFMTRLEQAKSRFEELQQRYTREN